MSDRSCVYCTKIFDYPCLLDRHLNSKKGCKMRNANLLLETPARAHVIQKKNEINVYGTETPVYQEETPVYQEETFDDNISDNDIEDNKNINNLNIDETPINKLQCNYCKFIFKDRSGISQHIKKLRCKKLTEANILEIQKQHELKAFKKQKVIEILNINKKVTDNLTNGNIQNNINNTNNTNNINNINNINNGIINNTTNIYYINPLGLESVKNITMEMSKKILEGGKDNFVKLLLECLYSQIENQNFYKDNLNKPHIAYIDESYTIKYMHETQLKEIILKNIPNNIDQLIYQHQDTMDPETIRAFFIYSIKIQDDISKNSNSQHIIDVGNLINFMIRTMGIKRQITSNVNDSKDIKKDIKQLIDSSTKEKALISNEINIPKKPKVKQQGGQPPLQIEQNQQLANNTPPKKNLYELKQTVIKRLNNL